MRCICGSGTDDGHTTGCVINDLKSSFSAEHGSPLPHRVIQLLWTLLEAEDVEVYEPV